jgi:hypothetical protein
LAKRERRFFQKEIVALKKVFRIGYFAKQDESQVRNFVYQNLRERLLVLATNRSKIEKSVEINMEEGLQDNGKIYLFPTLGLFAFYF